MNLVLQMIEVFLNFIFTFVGCSILNGLKHSNVKRPHLDENSPHTLTLSDNRGPSGKDSKSAASSMQRLASFLKPPMRTGIDLCLLFVLKMVDIDKFNFYLTVQIIQKNNA